MHHSAFEYDSFDRPERQLPAPARAGIEPDICIDHGMTLSYYYKDPDGNRVELQVDNFGDWDASREWMRTSADFHANPIGVFVDPARIAAGRRRRRVVRGDPPPRDGRESSAHAAADRHAGPGLSCHAPPQLSGRSRAGSRDPGRDALVPASAVDAPARASASCSSHSTTTGCRSSRARGRPDAAGASRSPTPRFARRSPTRRRSSAWV